MQVGWHPDPFGRHEQRFYDGVRWTSYVKDGDAHAVDEPVGPPAPSTGDGAVGSRRSVLTEAVLVVHQRPKLVELTDEYDVLDAHGEPVALVREVGQGGPRRAVRALTDLDDWLTHRLEVLDADGSLVLALTRRAPAGRRVGTVVVNTGTGQEVGRFEEQWRLGKNRFSLLGDHGTPLGELEAQNWREWNHRVVDLAGREVATISKSWRGLATEAFTTADSYVLRLTDGLDGALRAMAVATPFAVDLVRKQSDHSASLGYGSLGLAGHLARSLLD